MTLRQGGRVTTHTEPATSTEESSLSRGTKAFLTCGVVYGVSFVAAHDLLAGLLYDGYSHMDQAVSELSAMGASTRPLLAALVPVWSGLLIAFGTGVFRAASGNRPLRVTGGLLIAHGVVSMQWFWFPMTARDDIVSGATRWNDAGHLALASWSVVLCLAEIGFGAAALGTRFRMYSLVTVGTALGFGALTSTPAANLADGDPTPLMGLYERMSVGAWLLWIAVLSVILLRSRPEPTAARRARVQARCDQQPAAESKNHSPLGASRTGRRSTSGSTTDAHRYDNDAPSTSTSTTATS